MRDRRYGRILNIASSIALVPTPKMVEYAAAKAGIIGFTRSLALELAPFGVTVNAVSPGPIKTPGTDRVPASIMAKSVDAVPMAILAHHPMSLMRSRSWSVTKPATSPARI